MSYDDEVLALTPDFGKLSISPESSDGFASVGTILPKEEVTLLPGGLFAFRSNINCGGDKKTCERIRVVFPMCIGIPGQQILPLRRRMTTKERKDDFKKS
jgi:hypothetical protein